MKAIRSRGLRNSWLDANVVVLMSTRTMHKAFAIMTNYTCLHRTEYRGFYEEIACQHKHVKRIKTTSFPGGFQVCWDIATARPVGPAVWRRSLCFSGFVSVVW